jgi:hypothetical protein
MHGACTCCRIVCVCCIVLTYCIVQFIGSSADLDAHLTTCQYESVKGVLAENDARIMTLMQSLEARDQEIDMLRTMISQLTERVGRSESMLEERIGGCRLAWRLRYQASNWPRTAAGLEEHFTRLGADMHDSRRTIGELSGEVSTIQAKLGLVDGATQPFFFQVAPCFRPHLPNIPNKCQNWIL